MTKLARSIGSAVGLGILLAGPGLAQQNTSALGQNGWFADDVRADGTSASPAGTNLISPTLTDAPENTSGGANAAFDAEIRNQVRFLRAPGIVPAGTHTGALNLRIGPSGSGKSQISHRDTSPTGHATGMAAFGPAMTASYSWMGMGTPSVTTSFKLGVRTADFGATGVSSRTGENAWDKVMIYEPGNLNGGIADGTWRTETLDFTTGRWWFFDRTVGAGTIGTPLTLQQMSTSGIVFSGTKTIQDVYNLITAPGAVITSVQFGIGSGNAGGNVFVNELTTNFYRAGDTTTFGCDGYEQGFEVDDSGWNVFAGFDSVRVPSGTNGVTSANGAWHAEAEFTNGGGGAATNWGGYTTVCGCASSACAAGAFPPNGYRTSLAIYLDVDTAWANDTRFDFSSAINDPAGVHRRDFIFNAGFYNALDLTGPGAGTNRFIVAASNNAPGAPKLGVAPFAISTTGWYTFVHQFYDAGAGQLACRFSIRDAAGTILVEWVRSDASDIIGTTVGGNRYGWFPRNQFTVLAIDDAVLSADAGEGDLNLAAASCQDDVDPSPGYQIAVELSMADVNQEVSGFFASVAYDTAVLAYRGELSSYTNSPFPLHITSVVQGDDGILTLDGSVGFGGLPVTADALLATLVFTVLDECDPANPPVTFDLTSPFPSELSLRGDAVATTLTNPAPFTLDDTAPVLSPCPLDIVQPADASLTNSCAGAVVTYTAPTAVDNCDLNPVIVCTPPSGSFFPVGTTPVLCTATDACGNQSSCTFNVTVTPTNLFVVDVDLVGVTTPVSRCIRFVSNGCTTTSTVVSFTDHDSNPATPVRGTAAFELPCALYDGLNLCVKDEQHTLWASDNIVLMGTMYGSTAPVQLLGGDTDNDGDVDINDVTLFLAQFGGLAQAGGCAWNGTRDADFSNNGAVGSEDYTFLTANWLTTSSCVCGLVSGRGNLPNVAVALPVRAPVTTSLMSQADFDNDGWIDVKDVEILEKRLRLSGELSRRMRSGR